MESTFAVLQDAGRPTGSWWGVATNGAADQFSFAYANALVGNDNNSQCLETVASDLVVHFSHATVIAVAGAQADVSLSGAPLRTNQAVHVPAGGTVSVRSLRQGIRAYLAVLGGFHLEQAFLGSISPDRTMGFGFPARPGSTIAYEPAVEQRLPQHPFGFPYLPPRQPAGPVRAKLDVLPGENEDLFADSAKVLYLAEYEVTTRTDAVGSRLRGVVPQRLDSQEILSRALPVGAIEVSGSELLVLNRGRGLSAGYPVVGVISGPSMNTLSQLAPGSMVRFTAVTIEAALRERRRQAEAVASISERMCVLLSSALPKARTIDLVTDSIRP